MRRRDLVSLCAGMVITWPFTARGQSAEKPIRIGFLPLGSPSNAFDQSLVEALRQGLRDVGLVENRDVRLKWHGSATSRNSPPR
jgi:putative ABC transport system substrate-binding protein